MIYNSHIIIYAKYLIMFFRCLVGEVWCLFSIALKIYKMSYIITYMIHLSIQNE